MQPLISVCDNIRDTPEWWSALPPTTFVARFRLEQTDTIDSNGGKLTESLDSGARSTTPCELFTPPLSSQTASPRCLSPGPNSPRCATPVGRWIPATSAGMTRVFFVGARMRTPKTGSTRQHYTTLQSSRCMSPTANSGRLTHDRADIGKHLPGHLDQSADAAVDRIFFQFTAALAIVPALSFWNMRKISSLRKR